MAWVGVGLEEHLQTCLLQLTDGKIESSNAETKKGPRAVETCVRLIHFTESLQQVHQQALGPTHDNLYFLVCFLNKK